MSLLCIKPKGWEHFQHYKKRRPPWIKLYRNILDDYDFQCLQLASKALAPCLWLIASEHEEGLIVVDFAKLSWRLRVPEMQVQEAIKELIDKGFFIVASGMLAECLHDAIPETEQSSEQNIVPTELVDLPSTTRADAIPYKSIIEAYNEICVPLGKPAARRNNPKRQARIRQIWNESSRTRTVDWWRDYFAKAMTVPYIAKGFITRDGSLWNGADLDYLLQDKTITRIVEGSYDHAQR